MQVEFTFYGTLRDGVGEKTLVRDLGEGTTALEAVRAVADEYESLEPLVFRSGGELRPNVTVSVDGDPILEDADDEVLSDGAALSLAPGVSGGAVPSPAPGVSGGAVPSPAPGTSDGAVPSPAPGTSDGRVGQ